MLKLPLPIRKVSGSGTILLTVEVLAQMRHGNQRARQPDVMTIGALSFGDPNGSLWNITELFSCLEQAPLAWFFETTPSRSEDRQLSINCMISRGFREGALDQRLPISASDWAMPA